MRFQAVFFDIDGTLVSSRTKHIPGPTKRVLSILREKGLLLFVATERHIIEIKEEGLLGNLLFDGYITLNGQ